MTVSKPLGVAVVGSTSDQFSREHCDAQGGASFHIRRFVDPHEALRDTSTDVMVLCSSVRDRSYWLQEVVTAGKHAMCAPPLSSSFRRLQRLTRSYVEAGRRVTCLTDAGVPALSNWLATPESCGRAGAVLYLRLEVSISRIQIEEDAEGILLRHAVPYLALLSRWGAVDTVLSRARSFVANRPTEDLAVGFMRFSTGVEASVEFNGLGSTDAVSAEFYGRNGHVSFTQKVVNRSISIREQITNFTSRIDDDGQALSDIAAISRGHRLAGWMLQSARFDRELNKGEVQLD